MSTVPVENAEDEALLPGAIGIVVVHGVMPHPEYEIQDECATQLATQLNDVRGGSWTFTVVNPPNPATGTTAKPLPTISRVHRLSDEPTAPTEPYFDIIEAYWSPLDKGVATFNGVAGWLLQTIFVPLNTTARYISSYPKTRFDVALVGGGIALVVIAVAASLLLAAATLAAMTNTTFENLVPKIWAGSIFGGLTVRSLIAVVIGAAGSYIIAQAAKASFGLASQTKASRQRPAQRDDRIRLIRWTFATGFTLLAAAWPIAGTPLAMGMALTGPLFVAGRTLAESFITNFFGDVQIYTTRDQNMAYSTMREKMLAEVTETVLDVTSDGANGGRGYDRVYIFAHSLGSTIALDAIMRFASLVSQAPPALGTPPQSGLAKQFARIRGFITFGSPLEKTKYFFDVNNPSPSLAFDQWSSDAYGPLFTCDVRVLDSPTHHAPGIFWCNYWYFQDPVANELDSYRSFVPVGGKASSGRNLRKQIRANIRAAGDAHHIPAGKALAGRCVVRNERGHQTLGGSDIVPHGRYLGDRWFWVSDSTAEPTPHLGVLDIVAPTTKTASRIAFAKSTSRRIGGATYDLVDEAKARGFHDFEPPIYSMR